MENWKDIKGYEGYYQVSDRGRVKSLGRTIIRSNGVSQTFSQRILKPAISKNGYYSVALLKDGNQKTHCIHRLVADAFLTESGECINHKDGNKLNNAIQNLERCSYSYNNKHAYDYGLHVPVDLHGTKNPISKKVYQLKDGVLVKVWDYMSQTREAGFNPRCVSNVCLGKTKSHKGYQWSYSL